MKKERFYLFDNLKGLMILFVVWGHIIESTADANVSIHNLYSWIYSFHMPVFVFCTGYFGKYDVKKIKHRFMYPCIIFSVLYLIFKIYVLEMPNVSISDFPYHHLWYFMSSIFWYISIPFIENNTRKQNIILLIISLILVLIVGFFNDINKLFSISRTICFYPFFLLGYFAKKLNKEKLLKIIKNKYFKIITLLLFITISLILLSGYVSFPRMSFYYNKSYEVIKSSMTDRLQILCCNFVGLGFFLSYIPNKKIKLLSYIGKKTIYVFTLHAFFTLVFKKFAILSIFNHPIIASLIFTLIITTLTLLPITQKLFKNLISYPSKKQEIS